MEVGYQVKDLVTQAVSNLRYVVQGEDPGIDYPDYGTSSAYASSTIVSSAGTVLLPVQTATTAASTVGTFKGQSSTTQTSMGQMITTNVEEITLQVRAVAACSGC